jgi:hypothetical protein
MCPPQNTLAGEPIPKAFVPQLGTAMPESRQDHDVEHNSRGQLDGYCRPILIKVQVTVLQADPNTVTSRLQGVRRLILPGAHEHDYRLTEITNVGGSSLSAIP